jgi:hypothetical protein
MQHPEGSVAKSEEVLKIIFDDQAILKRAEFVSRIVKLERDNDLVRSFLHAYFQIE